MPAAGRGRVKARRWYHGGIAGLGVGDWLLPRTVTGWPSTEERLAQLGIQIEGMEPDRNRDDRVFLTWQRRLARAYAWHWAIVAGERCGSVYIAEPAPAAEPDPDLPEHGIQCERARVLSVEIPRVVMSTLDCAQILQSVATADALFMPGKIQFGSDAELVVTRG